ncbi:hypothetical protein [Pseudomonas umsongensis]|uniref:hypothetical protein n=1 Tax=Pseudomonas umsongensis TaxID=198618 RepID=UPI0003811068|nr:hypothetical protein [Pseudomonas umsongensis]
MSDFFAEFGALIENAEVQEPPTYGLFRVKREKTYGNYSGQYERPQTAALLANLRLPANAVELMTENGHQTGMSEREGLAAIAAMQLHAVPGPVTRGDGGAVDFYDGLGIPFDVKTPRTGFNMTTAADAVIHEMEGSQAGNAGDTYSSRVVLDTTFLTNGERGALWGQLSMYASNRRLIEITLPYGTKAKVVRFV